MEGGSALVEGKVGSSVAGTNVPIHSYRKALDRTVDGLVLGSPLPVDEEYDFWIDNTITDDSDFCFFGNKPAQQRFCAENKLSFFVTHWITFVWREEPRA